MHVLGDEATGKVGWRPWEDGDVEVGGEGMSS